VFAKMNRHPDFVPELDYYWSAIAGLASATHWRMWPLKKVQRYLNYLQREQAANCATLTRCLPWINPVDTPSLYADLEVGETLRLGLIPHLELVVRPRALAARISRRNKRR